MTILFYHRSPINPNSGGISRITHVLGQALMSHGYKIYYISELRSEQENSGITQYYLPNSSIVQCEENVLYLKELVVNLNINIIINQFALNGVSARFLNICKKEFDFKLISCFHNSILTPIYNFSFQKEFFLKRKNIGWLSDLLKTDFVKELLFFIYKRKHKKHYLEAVLGSDACVNLCQGLEDELLKLIGFKSFKNLYLIPNCIDVPNDKCNFNSKINEVLWVGEFTMEVKRPDIVLSSWKLIQNIHPDWKLRLLGSGRDLEQMQTYSKSLGLKNVSFEGRVNPDKYYKRARILCVTSAHESFSLVTVEAKSYNVVPIVMNSFPAASIVVRDNIDGLLVKPMDVLEYAKKLDYLMANEDILKCLSNNCADGIEMFKSNTIVKQWISLFDELI